MTWADLTTLLGALLTGGLVGAVVTGGLVPRSQVDAIRDRASTAARAELEERLSAVPPGPAWPADPGSVAARAVPTVLPEGMTVKPLPRPAPSEDILDRAARIAREELARRRDAEADLAKQVDAMRALADGNRRAAHTAVAYGDAGAAALHSTLAGNADTKVRELTDRLDRLKQMHRDGPGWWERTGRVLDPPTPPADIRRVTVGRITADYIEAGAVHYMPQMQPIPMPDGTELAPLDGAWEPPTYTPTEKGTPDDA